MNSFDFSMKLLKEGDVAASPGGGFGPAGEGHLRLALVENENRLRQAVRQIGSAAWGSKGYTDGMGTEYERVKIGKSTIVHTDCFEWLSSLSENTFHAIVTDPPYGVKEVRRGPVEKAQRQGWHLAHSPRGSTGTLVPLFLGSRH